MDASGIGSEALTYVGIAALLVLSAFFSGSETAIFSLTRLQVQKLRDENSRANRAILRLLDDPSRLIITVLVGNNIVNTAVATVVTSLMLRLSASYFGWDVGAALTVAMVVSTSLLLLCGEITPKTYALLSAEPVARSFALPLAGLAWLISPIRFVLRFVVMVIGRLIGIRDLARSELITQEEFHKTVSDGEAMGTLAENERDFIHRIVELREMCARDIMVPRTEMICVESAVTLASAFATAQSVGHSRIPVYEGSVDNIVYVLHIKDYPKWHRADVLSLSLRDIGESVSDRATGERATLLRRPFLLPETKRLNALLRDFSSERTQMAILLDEYGGTAGLITLEDIVEEITGDIVDEFDALLEPELTANLSPEALRRDGVVLPAKLSLRVASRLLRAPLDADVADTLGGYIFSLFDRVPSVGETVEDGSGFSFQVVSMTGTRIQKALVRKRGGDSEPETEVEA